MEGGEKEMGVGGREGGRKKRKKEWATLSKQLNKPSHYMTMITKILTCSMQELDISLVLVPNYKMVDIFSNLVCRDNLHIL